MTFLPIVDRELRIAARLTSTYRNRIIIAGVATFTGMVMFAFGAFAVSPARTGSALFWTLAYMALMFCLVEGVRKTADCLSEEKREGTLGLLFLTDLRGYDIILGKLAAKSLNSIYGLLSILPVLALALLLGGTTAGEYWRVVLALTNILLFSLCAGIWISCWCREERQAFTATFVFIAAWAGLPFLTRTTALFVFSPAYSIAAAADADYLSAPESYWYSFGFTMVLNLAMLIWASLFVPYCWREEKIRAPKLDGWRNPRKTSLNRALLRGTERIRMLNMNPVYWLAARRPGDTHAWFGTMLVAWLVMMILSLRMKADFWIPYLLACYVLNLVIKMRVGAHACQCFAEARRNNALELLLVTPLTIEQLISGQILALKRSFQVPVIVLLALEVMGLIFGFVFTNRVPTDNGILIFTIGFCMVWYFIFFALDVAALASVGMWHGLTCKSQTQAVTRTILLVVVLPTFCMFFYIWGIPFVIGLPIMFLITSRENLRREFRKQAGKRYSSQADSTWFPRPMNQNPTPTFQ